MALTPADEEIASQYRMMLRLGLPEGAVMQRMAIGSVPKNIQDAVLAPEDVGSTTGEGEGNADQMENKTDHPKEESKDPEPDPPVSYSYNPDVASQGDFTEEEVSEILFDPTQQSMGEGKRTNSYYEEIIIDDDEMIEEEIVDDNGDYEEEILEEIVDDIDIDVDHGEVEVEDQEIDVNGDAIQPAPTDNYTPTFNREYEPGFGNNTDPEHTGPNTTDSEHTGPNPTTNIPTYVYDDSNAADDVENQERTKAYQQHLPTKTLEELQPSPNSCWYWIMCLVFIGLIVASAGVGYWLTTRDGDQVSSLKPIDYTSPPTPAPSSTVSTEFNAMQGNCAFDVESNPNPNPIDQCKCAGEITVIEADIRERYLYNLEQFIPEHFEDYDDEISSCSPRNQALVWISSGDDANLTNEQRAQKFALASIFVSLGGSQWDNYENWLSYNDVCTWFGVRCDQDYVTELVLHDNNLIGMLPSTLSLLERLQFLMVARNQINGPLPVSLFSLQSLGTVDVSFNVMTGVIPPTVGDALSLNSLNVENNSMSGRLTRSIGKVTNLGYLNLKSNKFASELPIELFDLPRMRELYIGDNKFFGTIPAEFSKLSELTTLTLGPNLFTGTIPTTMSSLSRLRYLSISGVADLSGRIPAEFGFELSDLEELTISGTRISGNIDTSFGSKSKLKSLDFSANQLRSMIPSELGNLSNLVALDLGYNFLDGQIPEAIGNILTLEQLRLNNNLLQGGIPLSISNLIFLNTMRLEANRFEDRVRDSICDLRQNSLDVFVVDCPISIEGLEMFGVVCSIPECCTECVPQ